MTVEEKIIRDAMKDAGIRNRRELAGMIGVSDGAMKRKFRLPETLTVRDLRRIATVTNMSAERMVQMLEGRDGTVL